MEQFIVFVCDVLCASVLFLSVGDRNPGMQEEGAGGAGGVVVQNKAPAVFGCPVARYPVRSGRDPDVNLIDLSATTRTTVEAMRSWPTPGSIPAENRISPYETTVVVLEATLVQYQKERNLDGSDYRLVLADESGRTIIAKIAAPDCAVQEGNVPGLELPDSVFLEGLESSRARFDAWRTPNTTVERADIPVRIVGIGMFDSVSGQTGEAPNGIQLCPVLSISFDVERIPVLHVPAQHLPKGGIVRR